MALYKPPENATGEEIARGRDKWMERIKESRAGATASAAAPLESPEMERAYLNLLNFGMSPAAVAEVRTSKGASPDEREMARTWKAQFMNDKAKQAKYMDGDSEVRKQFIAANFLLSLPVIRKAT
jgi:hypothetical protein